MAEKRYWEGLRKLCRKGKLKDLLKAVRTTEDLKQGFQPDLSQPLHYFAGRGNTIAVSTLIDKYGCSPECQNQNGITPLHCASYCGRISVVKYLVDRKKCDINIGDSEGACPLVYAVYCTMSKVTRTTKPPFDSFGPKLTPRCEHIQVVKYLLTHLSLQEDSIVPKGLCVHVLRLPVYCDSFRDFVQLESILKCKFGDDSVEITSEMKNCLEIAISEGKWGFAENLLHTYTNTFKSISSSDVEQACAPDFFHTACAKGSVDFVKLFFQLDICKPDVDSVMKAIERKHYELICCLIECADHSLLMDRCKPSYRYFIKEYSLLGYIFEYYKYDKELLDVVVARSIDSDMRDAEGNSPLHLACKCCHLFAIGFYSNYHQMQETLNSHRQLPLHIACKSYDTDTMKLVSSHLGNSTINKKDSDGNTPLHIVCKSQNFSYSTGFGGKSSAIFESLKYLILEKNCDVIIQNNEFEFPLHIFLKRGDFRYSMTSPFSERDDIVKLLTSDVHINVNAQDSNADTVMHLACKLGDTKTVMHIASNFECDLNLINSEECLPLHYILESSVNVEAIRAVSQGCTLKFKPNNKGKTPLHLLCERIMAHSVKDQKLMLLELISNEQSINVKDNDGNTPLHIACKKEDVDTVLYLTSTYDCDVNLPNNCGNLPLHYAATSSDLQLVKSVANGCALIHMQNADGMTPLHIACKHTTIHSMDVIKYFVFEKKCFPNTFKYSSDIYDNLDIRFFCEDESDTDILKILANEQNINNKFGDYYDLNTPLHVACEHQNLPAIKLLLKLDSNSALSKGYRGRLSLHVACSQSLDCVKLIIPHMNHEYVNYCDDEGDTPLHVAFREDHLDIVEFLLSTFSCDVSIKGSRGRLPLHMACSVKSMKLIKLIVESRIDDSIFDQKTIDGDTALHIACRLGAIEVVKYLVEVTDCKSSMISRNSSGRLPIDYACEHCFEMVKLVSELCTVKELASRDYDSEVKFSYWYTSRCQHTTLDIACCSGILDTVVYLIKQKGCSLPALGNDPSALGYACGLLNINDCNKDPKHDIVRFLISECGYDPGVTIQNQSVCFYACKISDLELVKALTVCKVDISDSTGSTLLHYACQGGCTDIVQYLVEHECDQNVVNKSGELALHVACRTSLEIARMLTKCDINMQNTKGNTPLHIACESMKEDIVSFLAEKAHCDLSVTNREGEYALHTAVNNSIEVENLVLKSDINCQDKHGDTPLHNACYNQDSKTIRFLLDHKQCRADIPNEDGDLALHIFIIDPKQKEISDNEYFFYYPYDEPKPRIENLPLITEMVLKRYKAAVTAVNHEGLTPFHIAIGDGNMEVFQVLYRGGDFDKKFQQMLLRLACEEGQSQIVHYLLDHEAYSHNNDILYQHLCFKSGKSCLSTLKELGPLNICNQDENKDTILHLACRQETVDVLAYILLSTSDYDLRFAFSLQNKNSDSPLHLLSTKVLVSPKIFDLIKCDNPNIQDLHGNTPLHLACQHKHSILAKHLLYSCQCNPNILNDQDELPLHIAVAQSNLELVKIMANPKSVQKQTKTGDTPLHIACQQVCLDIIEYLLSINNDVSIPNNVGDTPLHIAVTKSFDLVKKLVEKADTSCIPSDKANVNGDTILHIACWKADHQTVSFLVNSLGCKPDTENKKSGATPLHFACANGSLPMVKLVSMCNQFSKIKETKLLPKKFQFSLGDTPLHVACRIGKINIVRHLLRSGHLEALNCHNELQEFPIHVAFACRMSKFKVMVDLFVSQRKHHDINIANRAGDTPLHIICRYNSRPHFVKLLIYKLRCKIDQRNKEGNLPLHIACQNKRISKNVIETLSIGLNNDLLNNNGNSPLHELFQYPHNKYNLKEFECILEKLVGLCKLDDEDKLVELMQLACHHQKLDVVHCLCENYIQSSFKVPLSVLYEVCLNRNQGVLEYVLERFEHDINIPNKDKDLPLHLATRVKGCVKGILLLIERTANVNHTNSQGNTPLHELYCNIENNVNTIPKLLTAFLNAKGIDISIQNSKGQTPLHCMFKSERYADFKIVLAHSKVDPDIKDNDGLTLLHIVCQSNNLEATELLLSSAKANPSVLDNYDKSPIAFATDPEIIKLLIKYGADPTPLYDMHRKFFALKEPPQTPVKLLVIGDPLVGKTTLIQSLQNEYSEKIISESFDRTAGVVPTNFTSKIYGEVTFYDFAGQPEYYASHDAVIHSTVKNLPPIVFIVVNLTEEEIKLLDQIHYWINFITNRCAKLTNKAHLVIIGSHADVLEKESGIIPSEKVAQLLQSVSSKLIPNKKIDLKSFLYIDCTKAYSNEILQLQEILHCSTSDLREKGVMNFNLHCFNVFLLHQFKDDNVISVSEVINKLQSMSEDSKSYPLYVLPSSRHAVIQMCRDIEEKGFLMFIAHPTIRLTGWLIQDTSLLYSKLLGELFGKTTKPSKHDALSCSTGVVPLSHFEEHFCMKHNYPAMMALTFLSRMEYCRQITDKLVLESILEKDIFLENEKYYYFPELVDLERPNDKWSTDPKFNYKCGWLIQCTTKGEYFSPHFVQALLLRLAFSFTPKKVAYDSKDIETYKRGLDKESAVKVLPIKRLCSVWKNGIYWQEESSVKTIIDIIDRRTLVVLMQCFHKYEIDLLKRRSQIISMVLNAKEEFCSEADLLEYFIHPMSVTHPLVDLESIQSQLFSFPQVKRTIIKKHPCVINEHNESVTLEELLYYEPYSELARDVRKAKIVQCHINEEQISIFRGRQPPQGYGQALSVSAVPTLRQLDFVEGNGKTVRVIRSAASKWKLLATRLHFEYNDISRIREDNHCQCLDACFVVCGEWLSGAGRKPMNWTTLITALREAELSEVASDLEVIIPHNLNSEST